MTARTAFAIAHLGGTLVGVVAGGTLPWWASGSVAWAMAGLLLAALFAIRAPATVAKPIVLGAWWGGLMGAAATDMGQTTGVPGELVAILLAGALLVGEAITHEDKPLPLGLVGLVVYLGAVGLCALPWIVEVLS